MQICISDTDNTCAIWFIILTWPQWMNQCPLKQNEKHFTNLTRKHIWPAVVHEKDTEHIEADVTWKPRIFTSNTSVTTVSKNKVSFSTHTPNVSLQCILIHLQGFSWVRNIFWSNLLWQFLCEKGPFAGVLGCGVTLSTCACEACCSVSSTMSRYFLNSPPMARAISPKTDRIWGFTDLCTFSFCKHTLQHYYTVSRAVEIPLNILLERQMKLYRALETK